MANETHLRELASRCLWLSHNCYDLSAAAQLRVIATELNAEAVESEARRRMNLQGH